MDVELQPMGTPVEAEAQVSAFPTVTPGHEDFFSKFRSHLPQQEFDDFREIISRERDYNAQLFTKTGHQPFRNDFSTSYSVNDMLKTIDWLARSNVPDVQNVLLIEDVDIRSLMYLSATYDLDPQFLLSYVGFDAYPGFIPESTFHKADTGVAGSWYTASGSTSAKSEWYQEPSNPPSRSAWNRAHNLLEPGKSPPNRAWWQEAHRRHARRTASMIGCYCLTSTVRLVLVESSPQIQSPNIDPFKLTMALNLSDFYLPMPLENWMAERRFPVSECFRGLLCGEECEGRVSQQARDDLLLFGLEDATPPDRAKLLAVQALMLWPLVAYRWWSNVAYLKRSSGERRYKALLDPGMHTYLPLMQLRQLIVGMRDDLPRANDKTSRVMLFYKRILPQCPQDEFPTLPQTLAQVLEDLNKLDKELNDEIHLIIGAVTVQDSDATKQQAERATLLTLLAAVYLPLTLVTGIFGMNIKEFDGGATSTRDCWKTFGAVAGLTVVFVASYQLWRRWRKRKARQRVELGGHWKTV